MKREYDFSKGVRGRFPEAEKKIMAAKPKRGVIQRVKMWALFFDNGELDPRSFRFHRFELESAKRDHPNWIWTIRPVVVEYEILAKGKEK